MIFKKGETVEVGYGEYDEISEEVEDGGSIYTLIDVESISESEIESIFKDYNILYIEKCEEKQGIMWSLDNPISKSISK